MKLVTYHKLDGTWQPAEWRDGNIYTVGGGATLLDIIGNPHGVDIEEQYKVRTETTITLPYRPPKILGVGRNYKEHATELGNTMPEKPLIFAKYSSSTIGDGAPIQWRSSLTQQVDWEGELAVVIGKKCHMIDEAQAEEVIFGYTIVNDVTARDLQESDKQWARAKGMDTFCPMGPYIVTKDEIEDPHNLRIQTHVNGELMQDGHTSDMFYRIPFLIAYLSQAFTLEAGDLILTGTPAGVGKGMKPPRFLKDGDVVSISIDGLGTLTNPCKVLD